MTSTPESSESDQDQRSPSPSPTKQASQNQTQDNGRHEIQEKTINNYLKVLDDLVSVNSLFTFAVFIGISFASSNPQTLELRKGCQADRQTTMTLLVNEVVSFVCFLLSSLLATALKMHLSMYIVLKREGHADFGCLEPILNVMILLSTLGSILGCVYLTLSMVDVVRVLLGKIACGASDTVQAAGSLVGIDSLALIIYVPYMMLAVYHSYDQLRRII